MIEVSFPGKLFLMGEYAVMETGIKSVVSSVDARLFVNVSGSDDYSVQSRFGSVKGSDVFSMDSMKEVSAAINVTKEFIQRDLKHFNLVIQSELDDGETKYGFGSSGVVIVGVLSALLKHEGIELTQLELFKLSVMVQYRLNSFSSGGDLAAAIYDDVLIYARYDLNWLKGSKLKLNEIIKVDWPYLQIESLTLPYSICIGWTGTSNKTESYTDAVNRAKENDPMTYRAFLVNAARFVDQFIEAQDEDEFSHAVRGYRRLMVELGSWAKINIETDDLRNLIDSAESLNISAKISGSGGGDCGIAFISDANRNKLDALNSLWENYSIKMIQK